MKAENFFGRRLGSPVPRGGRTPRSAVGGVRGSGLRARGGTDIWRSGFWGERVIFSRPRVKNGANFFGIYSATSACVAVRISRVVFVGCVYFSRLFTHFSHIFHAQVALFSRVAQKSHGNKFEMRSAKCGIEEERPDVVCRFVPLNAGLFARAGKEGEAISNPDMPKLELQPAESNAEDEFIRARCAGRTW